jgi:hypothetical protein
MHVALICALGQLDACALAPRDPVPTDWYAISLDSDVKDIGSTSLAIIHNLTSTTLRFNLCERVLQRRENGHWVVVDTMAVAAGCERTPLNLPGKVAVDTYVSLPKNTPPGAYRIVFPGLLGPEGRPLPTDAHASAPFAIRSNR